jgi:hypothetical protein
MKPCFLVIVAVISLVLLLYVIGYFVLVFDVYNNHSSDLKLRLAQILGSITS